jgi:hypothetical protein
MADIWVVTERVVYCKNSGVDVVYGPYTEEKAEDVASQLRKIHYVDDDDPGWNVECHPLQSFDGASKAD